MCCLLTAFHVFSTTGDLHCAGRPDTRFGCSRYGQSGVPENRAVFRDRRNGGFISDTGMSLLYSLVMYVHNTDI